MMPAREPTVPKTDQLDRFKELARELGCDEDEAALEDALKRLAEAKPLLKHEPKKRIKTAGERL